MILDTAISRLKTFVDKTPVYMKEIIEQNENIIEDKVVNQLEKGLNEEGIKIGDYMPYQNKQYERYKNAINPRAGLGNPDLKLTGDFHRGIYAKTGPDYVAIGSQDYKTQMLTVKYGDGILGMTKESKIEFGHDVLKDGLINKFRND